MQQILTDLLQFFVLSVGMGLGVWFCLCGCGGKYDLQRVEGTVTLKDGMPLANLRLMFECEQPRISARAATDESGHYRVGTLETGDGAPAGHYRVVIAEPAPPDPDDPPPRRFHSKYSRFDTSGIEFTVSEGNNTFDIQLDPAGP